MYIPLLIVMQNKQPLYIGLFVEDEKEAYNKIHQYVLDCLKDIHKTYPQPNIQADIQNFDKIFNRTKDAPHITTLFLGKNKIDQLPQKNKQIYNQFLKSENEKQQLVCEGIVYVPGYLIAGICFPKVKSSNQYPHMTLYLGKDAKAVESNDVCEWAFKEDRQVYKQRKFETKEYVVKDAPAKFKNIFVTGRELVLPGLYRKA